MEWIVLEERDGRAIGLRGREGDFRAFPYHAVEKRIEANEHRFIVPIFRSLENARAQILEIPYEPRRFE